MIKETTTLSVSLTNRRTGMWANGDTWEELLQSLLDIRKDLDVAIEEARKKVAQ